MGAQGKGTGETWSLYFYPSSSQCARSRGRAGNKPARRPAGVLLSVFSVLLSLLSPNRFPMCTSSSHNLSLCFRWDHFFRSLGEQESRGPALRDRRQPELVRTGGQSVSREPRPESRVRAGPELPSCLPRPGLAVLGWPCCEGTWQPPPLLCRQRGTSFCTCFTSVSPQEAWTREEKVGEASCAWTRLRGGESAWSGEPMGFLCGVGECSVAVVLRAAAQCSQRHVCEFSYGLHSAPWTYVFGFRPAAPCFGSCRLWSRDVESRN